MTMYYIASVSDMLIFYKADSAEDCFTEMEGYGEVYDLLRVQHPDIDVMQKEEFDTLTQPKGE